MLVLRVVSLLKKNNKGLKPKVKKKACGLNSGIDHRKHFPLAVKKRRVRLMLYFPIVAATAAALALTIIFYGNVPIIHTVYLYGIMPLCHQLLLCFVL